MKKLFQILSLVTLPLLGTAQHFEVGVLIGASNYLGDLSNNSSSLYIKESKPAFGGFAKYWRNCIDYEIEG